MKSLRLQRRDNLAHLRTFRFVFDTRYCTFDWKNRGKNDNWKEIRFTQNFISYQLNDWNAFVKITWKLTVEIILSLDNGNYPKTDVETNEFLKMIHIPSPKKGISHANAYFLLHQMSLSDPSLNTDPQSSLYCPPLFGSPKAHFSNPASFRDRPSSVTYFPSRCVSLKPISK